MIFLKTFTAALALTLALSAHTALISPNPSIRPGTLPVPDLRCPVDPSATKIDFQILSTTSTYRGLVKIVGTIKNLGKEAFVSKSGQQIILLYEDSRIVARKPFINLASGATDMVIFQRNWDASSPAEGEFPPTYKVVISYDPDIFIDGNVKNDDCNQRNNEISRSGSGINDLF